MNVVSSWVILMGIFIPQMIWTCPYGGSEGFPFTPSFFAQTDGMSDMKLPWLLMNSRKKSNMNKTIYVGIFSKPMGGLGWFRYWCIASQYVAAQMKWTLETFETLEIRNFRVSRDCAGYLCQRCSASWRKSGCATCARGHFGTPNPTRTM